MSASQAGARSGYGTRFQMGDGAPTFTVTIAATPTGGVAPNVGATTLNVNALPGPLPNGSILIFGVGKFAELTAAAATGATTLSVKPLVAALAVGDDAIGGKNFATVGEMTDFTPPAPTTGTFETTHYLSPGGFAQFGVGMTDPGEANVTFNWLPRDPTQDGVSGLLKAFKDRKLRDFRIVYPFEPLVIDEFAGIVTTYPKTAPIGDRMTGSCTIKISGDITTNA